MLATDRPAVRLACLLDGSRMSPEVHVRFWCNPAGLLTRDASPEGRGTYVDERTC